jgi:predicted transcriptional regulator
MGIAAGAPGCALVSSYEFKERPGARLLELIEMRGLDYADVAEQFGMAGRPVTWSSGKSEAAEWRQRCVAALRHYTHGSKNTGTDMVVRWAEVLGVDPAYFFLDHAKFAGDKPMLFGVHPQWLDMFLDGSKLPEYRTRRPKVSVGDTILLYATAPRSRVEAKAVVLDILTGSPSEIWDRTRFRGIERPAYDKYFEGRSLAVALELKVTKLANPVPLPPGQAAPQGWNRWKGQWPLE